MRTRWTVTLVALAMLAASVPASAYVRFNPARRWPAGIIPMYLMLGPSPALIDGAPDWDTVAAGALNAWSGVLNGVVFQPNLVPGGVPGMGNLQNEVFWGDDVYGTPFPPGALAITLTSVYLDDNSTAETDVVFNRPLNFNSYRGALRPGGTGGSALPEFQRVALHEFGHALGLDHPDTNGQTVTSIMNARISNVEALQPDDVAGVTAVYKGPADTLFGAARLLPSQSLTSLSGQFRLAYQPDGNLVLFNDAAKTIVWTSGTGGIAPQQALMQVDGNFVMYDAAGGIAFMTNTGGNAGARFVLQNDGNFGIFGGDGTPLWDRVSIFGQ